MENQPRTRLEAWINAQRMTALELARSVDMQYSYVTKFVRGDLPPTDGFRVAFMEAFGVKEAYVAGIINSHPEPTTDPA